MLVDNLLSKQPVVCVNLNSSGFNVTVTFTAYRQDKGENRRKDVGDGSKTEVTVETQVKVRTKRGRG